MRKKVRKTAINIIGDVPWGTHFCQFYQTKEDMIDILVPYFKAGLENNEFCMWITSEPLHVEDAKRALKEKVNNLDDYIQRGQIEILDYSQWYTRSGRFDSDEVLQGWVEKEKLALERGFEGLRLTGNTFWLEKRDWKDFTDYEAAVNSVIGQHHMLAVCTYSLDKCTASEIMDVVSNHQFAVIKREGKWEIIESTEHRKTAEALKAEKEFIDSAVNASTDTFFVFEPSTGKALRWNKTFNRVSGYSDEEIRSMKTPDSYYNEQDLRKAAAATRGVFREGAATVELSLITKDGRSIPTEYTGSVLKDSQGNPKYVIAVGRDITERKQAQKALEESEDKYRAIFAQAADSIVLIDAESGALVEFNDTAHENLGYTREEFQKLKIPDFEIIESAEEIAKHIKKIVREGADTFETKHRTKSGQIQDILVSSKAISIGGRDFVQSIWRDITDRKDMEAQQLFAGKILERINQKSERQDIVHDVLRLVKQFTGFEAVGIRLREGDDFPYFAVNGFSDEFVEAENYLCARGENGKQIYDSQGNPVLECMCGNVLSGRTDPALPFFTEGGSFWTNSTTMLLASTSEQGRQGRTRNHCNKVGYESVALIPLRSGDQIVGLLQLNDTRWGQFTPEMIRFFEGIGASIGIALARTRAEEEAKNLAKFPSENPFPVLRIAEDGTILYSNNAGLALLSKWKRQVGGSAPHDWCQLIGDVLDSNRNKIIEVKYGKRIISFVLAPVAKAGYVNIYGRYVTKQKIAEQALQKARDDLEEKVRQRTAELSDVVSALREEAKERSLAQQELQQSEARLRDAQRIAHIGNWDWDIVDNQLWWSDEVYRIFGLRPQEFEATYEAFLSHVHPDDREFVKQSVNEALYDHKPYSIDHRVVLPDGTERIVHEQAEVIRNANKSPIRMGGTVQDVTTRKQAEEKILDDQKLLRSLTAELLLSEERERRKIATDLHDSVGQILAFSDRELGTLQKSSPQKLMESVEEIRHHIKQAVKQTRTLTFDLSPPSLYDLGFEAAVEELVEQFSQERKIECDFESCDQHKPIADHIKILLYRSIRELLTNAAKHSTAKLVRITSSRVNNDIQITVEDDGTGFDISKLEPKAGNSRGFGLFSIRERLTHLGGQFDIQSSDGNGTKITLLVPLKPKKIKKRRIRL